MKVRHLCLSLAAAAVGVMVALGGCSGDTVNNYGTSLDNDSGVDVIAALQSLGCTPKKKDCVNETVARLCPDDGTAWVAITCRPGEKCSDGDCKPIAGGPTAACVPADGACLTTTQALRCREDGSGYQQYTCPAGTTCQNQGICKGAFVVDSSVCSGDRKSLLTSTDGLHQITTPCAAGEYCVSLHTTPFSISACKPATCKPTVAGAACGEQTQCGDPSTPTNDQTKYVASCVETPDGFKWVGAACLAGQTCNPNGQTCSNGNRFQAACGGPACTPGATRCAANGQGIQTCKTDGTWDNTFTQCNLAAGERCIAPLAAPSNTVACGDPVCAVGLGICDDATNGFRACNAAGKLQAPAACPIGRCVDVQATLLPPPQEAIGRCVAECTPGAEDCFLLTNTYRVCGADYRYGAPQPCPSADGSTATCATTSDPLTNLQKHVCLTGVVCVPGTKRCINADGGAIGLNGDDSIQLCQPDGSWGAPQACTIGSCTSVYSGGAQCAADCLPGSKVCDPTGAGGYVDCPANGKLPAIPSYSQTCPNGTSCKRAGARSIGCVQCVGPTLTDGVAVPYAEARCLSPDETALGTAKLQSCKPDNTWDTPALCSGGDTHCTSTFYNTPVADPGGVRYSYCN